MLAALFALTTNQKLGLGITAAIFIAFALLSALVIPRSRPEFPGRGLSTFVILTVILTIAMLGAVEVFAKEEEHAAETATETSEAEPQPEPQPEPPPPPGTTQEEEPSGSPEAGEAVFTAQGCGSCHTLAAAGTSGAVGPNLDESLSGKDDAYIRRAIVEPNADIAEGYAAGIMPQNYGEQLSEEQLNDLIALLRQG